MSTQSTSQRWSTLREELLAKRAARASQRAIRRDLSYYQSPASVIELRAIAARYDNSDARVIDEVLARRSA